MTFPVVITSFTLLLLLLALLRDLYRPHFLFGGALLLLLVTGVLSPTEAFQGFANEAVFTVAALFVVAAGVHRTGAFSFLDVLIFKEKSSLRTVSGKMMGATAVLSAFLNNTPIVAMLIPQVQAWADKKGIAASKLLLPLSYAAIVGGTATLVGTSTNIIVSGMMRQAGMEPIGLFELAYIGIPATVLTLLWFLAVGLRNLPEGRQLKPHKNTQNEAEVYQFEYKLPDHSNLSQKTIEGAGLRALGDAYLTHIQRNGQVFNLVEPGFILESGDVLTFAGTYEAVHAIASAKGLVPAVPGGQENQSDPLPLYEAVVSHSSPLVGKTLKEVAFREHFHAVVLAIQRKEERIQGALGSTPIKAGDMLLIESRPGFKQKYGNNHHNFYLVRRKGQRLPVEQGKSRTALGIVLVMLVVVAAGWLPMVTASLLAALAMMLAKCVRKEQLVNAVNLPILMVIATAIGIGKAVESSGLAAIAVNSLVEDLHLSHPVFYLVALYLMTNIFTELITNNAAAVLMFPIGVLLAGQVGIPPHAAGITVAIAASASFLTPIGYQTNLMVMSAGGYKFTDYTKAGIPVTCILMAVTVAVVWWRYM